MDHASGRTTAGCGTAESPRPSLDASRPSPPASSGAPPVSSYPVSPSHSGPSNPPSTASTPGPAPAPRLGNREQRRQGRGLRAGAGPRRGVGAPDTALGREQAQVRSDVPSVVGRRVGPARRPVPRRVTVGRRPNMGWGSGGGGWEPDQKHRRHYRGRHFDTLLNSEGSTFFSGSTPRSKDGKSRKRPDLTPARRTLYLSADSDCQF